MASKVPGVGNRPVKSCTECKQAKLRCDSRAKFPDSCSRCQSRKLNCTVDPSFRRTAARKRLETLSKEVQELRYQQRNASKPPPDSDSGRGQRLSGEALSAYPEMADHDFDSKLESIRLGSTLINKDTVIDVFKLFTEYFYPHLPIMGPVSIDEVHHSSPFLFWTIMVVVTSHCSERFDDDLQEPYMVLLRAEALNAPLPLHKIQALLYLCMWPLPVERQQEDPSWLYCGIAINSALYMGLNRSSLPPSLRSIGVVSGSPQARAKTWLGCFYVSTSLGMHLGLPPLLVAAPELAAIRTLLSEDRVPTDFALQVRVQLVSAGVASAISHGADHVLDASLIQLLDDQLAAIRITFPDGWTVLTEYSTLVTKLHFYAAVTAKVHSTTATSDILLKLGFATSLRIVQIANARVNDVSVDCVILTPSQRQRTLPKNYFRGLAFATVFLLKYFSLNNGANNEERQLAADHVAIAHGIFKLCSIHSQDEYGRVVHLIETLRRQLPTEDKSAGPRVTDRMGVSIVLDAISTAAEVRSESVEMSESTEPTASNIYRDVSFTDASHAELDFQATDPWPSDMALSNGFWNDPLWDIFNFETEASHT